MPRVKGMRLGKLKAQPALPPQQVTMPRRQREKGFGDTVKPVTHYQLLPEFRVYPEPIMTEQDQSILRSYRREMAQCDERACLCMCHCHGGPDCYKEELEEKTVHRFHFRQPNTSHKRAHRECPKGDSHKW